MYRRKVYLTGRDYVNWATDDDYRLTLKAIASFCDIVPPEEAEIIHTVNWHSLLGYDSNPLKDKYVIAHIPHDVKNMFLQTEFCKIASFVNLFIVPTTRAKRMLSECGIYGKLVPYAVDTTLFYPIDTADSNIRDLKNKYAIPKDTHLIGSFQRDTEGKDLKTPKYMKGPDVFFNIVKKVYNCHSKIHVILAGPRRFWLREQLAEANIPYTFIGDIIKDRDDLRKNTLKQEQINLLYNFIDLYVVGSRIEGGPKAILEASATKCKIISARVGSAQDILSKECLFDSVAEATQIITRDIQDGYLQSTVDINYKNALTNSVDKNSEIWREIYNNLSRDEKKHQIYFKQIDTTPKIIKAFWFLRRNKISILHKYHKPPWGGGNQFLLAFKKGVEKRGKKVINDIDFRTKACLFNSFTFDFAKLANKANKNTRMVHRVDGPTFLVRGKDKELDDKVFSINNKLADSTVFQSYWSLAKTLDLGYKPVNPVIIHNAVDPEIFNRVGKQPFSRDRKIKLISTSWSDNIRKGCPIYKWVDEHLDWNRFEYTFVGRAPGDFINIRLIPPQPSKKLAKILKEHDIYITASKNEPCSNALLEALACGLPTLYLDSGAHHELVGFGGLGFNSNEEILPQLDKLVEDYKIFQDLIVVPNIDEVVDKYLNLMEME